MIPRNRVATIRDVVKTGVVSRVTIFYIRNATMNSFPIAGIRG
jgi:ribosomal protein L19